LLTDPGALGQDRGITEYSPADQEQDESPNPKNEYAAPLHKLRSQAI
jgi:hypothetical protein